jgi:hypothetical protein
MNRAQKLINILDEGDHSRLDQLYSLRASFKVEGKRPSRDHKNFSKYQQLTKKIRKVRSRFNK